MAHVKKGDMVKVISGKYKTKTGQILEVDLKREKVKVKGIALATRHVKPSKNSVDGKIKKGGINIIEQYIHISNVKLIEKDSI